MWPTNLPPFLGPCTWTSSCPHPLSRIAFFRLKRMFRCCCRCRLAFQLCWCAFCACNTGCNGYKLQYLGGVTSHQIACVEECVTVVCPAHVCGGGRIAGSASRGRIWRCHLYIRALRGAQLDGLRCYDLRVSDSLARQRSTWYVYVHGRDGRPRDTHVGGRMRRQ